MHFWVCSLQWDGITDADSNGIEESLLLTTEERRGVDWEEDAEFSVLGAIEGDSCTGLSLGISFSVYMVQAHTLNNMKDKPVTIHYSEH